VLALFCIMMATVAQGFAAAVAVPGMMRIFEWKTTQHRFPLLTVVTFEGRWAAVAVGIVFSVLGYRYWKHPRAALWLLGAAILVAGWSLATIFGVMQGMDSAYTVPGGGR
jgi:hypothetical protein